MHLQRAAAQPGDGELNTGGEDFYSPGRRASATTRSATGGKGTRRCRPTWRAEPHGRRLRRSPRRGLRGCHAHNGDPPGGWRASGVVQRVPLVPGAADGGVGPHPQRGAHAARGGAADREGSGARSATTATTHNQSGYVDGGTAGRTDGAGDEHQRALQHERGEPERRATNLTYNGGGGGRGGGARGGDEPQRGVRGDLLPRQQHDEAGGLDGGERDSRRGGWRTRRRSGAGTATRRRRRRRRRTGRTPTTWRCRRTPARTATRAETATTHVDGQVDAGRRR